MVVTKVDAQEGGEKPQQVLVAPWARVTIMASALAVGGALSWRLTGSAVPTEPRQAIIFQTGLLLVVLGSAILEHKFTRPADSLVNSLMGIVSLVTVYATSPRAAWWFVFAYCALVFVMALACVALSTGPDVSGWRALVAKGTYGPAVYLGRARLLFSIVFLFGVFAFYSLGSRAAAVLVAFWGVFIALWPLRLPEFLTSLRRAVSSPTPLGRVVRREWPSLVRVELQPGVSWNEQEPRIYQDADGGQYLVVPLYKQVREQQALATGLLAPLSGPRQERLISGFVYDLPAGGQLKSGAVTSPWGADPDSHLVGIVIEDSVIGAIRFETWRPDLCREGLLVSCDVAGQQVFFQITAGITREETLESDRLGSQVGVAAQLGTLDTVGFQKCDWLPTMNTPVFAASDSLGQAQDVPEGDFVFGRIPGANLAVSGPLSDFVDFHTAILGVTGSGKTELAFDMIRHCVERGLKVICIDLTARYGDRLSDLDVQNLTISDDMVSKLEQHLFDVETGEYGAKEEKKQLGLLRSDLREDVTARLVDFLTSAETSARVGIITLNEISNTKATLFTTELYMTCLLNFAKAKPDTCPRCLVVVEEAHTVMPESSTMGLGDNESKALVSKISQIALQGRKYRIGLLVIAQRTATVTKTVLTQCNTIVAFNSFDETTTNFLAGMFGMEHAQAVRDLPRLHAVVYGKAVRSDRPLIVGIPFDPEKALDAPG